MNQEFITHFIYESNAIENSNLSYEETYDILWNNKEVKTKEEEMVVNQKKAFDYLQDHKEELNNGMIIQLGEIMNPSSKGYRKIPVMIQKTSYTPPPPEVIPSEMNQILYQYEHNELPITFRVAMYHILFEHIHPFEDGNGRVGRLILNHQLMMNQEKPIIIPKEQREEYFKYIETDDAVSFSEFIKKL